MRHPTMFTDELPNRAACVLINGPSAAATIGILGVCTEEGFMTAPTAE